MRASRTWYVQGVRLPHIARVTARTVGSSACNSVLGDIVFTQCLHVRQALVLVTPSRSDPSECRAGVNKDCAITPVAPSAGVFRFRLAARRLRAIGCTSCRWRMPDGREQ